MVTLARCNDFGHIKKYDKVMPVEEAVKWLHSHGYEMISKIVSNDGKATFYNYRKEGCHTSYYIEDRQQTI